MIQINKKIKKKKKLNYLNNSQINKIKKIRKILTEFIIKNCKFLYKQL